MYGNGGGFGGGGGWFGGGGGGGGWFGGGGGGWFGGGGGGGGWGGNGNGFWLLCLCILPFIAISLIVIGIVLLVIRVWETEPISETAATAIAAVCIGLGCVLLIAMILICLCGTGICYPNGGTVGGFGGSGGPVAVSQPYTIDRDPRRRGQGGGGMFGGGILNPEPVIIDVPTYEAPPPRPQPRPLPRPLPYRVEEPEYCRSPCRKDRCCKKTKKSCCKGRGQCCCGRDKRY